MPKNREIKKHIIHCSYTPPEMDIGVLEIRKWHKGPPNNWHDIGYHFVIRRSGEVEKGRDLDLDSVLEPNEIGAHVKGQNFDSIATCLVGGMRTIDHKEQVPDCNFTRQQWTALDVHVAWIESVYGPLQMFGHRDFNPNKACPCFDVRTWRYEVVVV